ncbi:MAG: hypothetical protein JW984_10940 [Deltaproteobacteria bacterium]|uniref:Uncharacterized protein n=1 Tax=Candidatus Zymogenus saltonus TaxID=2844893 RepID=A0A9D8KFG2_9DELT|nr:hypothetical protein [Candidatus Zymogenus saltonus]
MNRRSLAALLFLALVIISASLLAAEEGVLNTRGAKEGIIKGGAAVGMGGDGAYAFVVNTATRWFDTGIDVKKGDKITIVASASKTDPPCDGRTGCPPYRNPDDVIADGFAGKGLKALVSRIEAAEEKSDYSGDPFSVGKELILSAPKEGRLYLGYNDCEDCFSDNTGAFEVSISVEK